MKIQKDEGGSSVEFKLTPAGTHVARCVRVIDMGTQHTSGIYGEKHQRKLFVLYELPTTKDVFTDKDGNEKILPFSAVKSYTNSTYEKSALYQHLAAWFGDEFTNDPEGFEIDRMVGTPCMISVVHKSNEKTGERYANIAAITAMPEGMECPPQVNPSVLFDLDNFDQGVFDSFSDRMKAKIQSSPEFKVISGQAGQRNHQPVTQSQVPESENPAPRAEEPKLASEFVPDDLNDLPF